MFQQNLNKLCYTLQILQNFILYFQVHSDLSSILVGAIPFQAREHNNMQEEKLCEGRESKVTSDNMLIRHDKT